jgi:hypothetical protein
MARRLVRAVVVALVALGAAAVTVRADGLPVLGSVSAAYGVRSPDGTARYVAAPQHHGTIVRMVSASGRAVRSLILNGRYDVPVVAYDGSAAGVSANGLTLALIRSRVTFPQRSTELAIIAAGTLRLNRFVRLRGDFSFDAISPNGKWIYLIQYTSPADPTRYRVRALNTRTGLLLPDAIVDPHDRGEAMHGSPITRVSGPGGRWAYTLYDGNGRPFVHALDTAGRAARCIDVAALPANTDSWSVRLRLTGQRLMVVLGKRTLSQIDTRSLSLLPNARGGGRPSAKAASRLRSGAIGVAFPIVVLGVLLALAVLTLVRRRLGPLSSKAPVR